MCRLSLCADNAFLQTFPLHKGSSTISQIQPTGLTHVVVAGSRATICRTHGGGYSTPELFVDTVAFTIHPCGRLLTSLRDKCLSRSVSASTFYHVRKQPQASHTTSLERISISLPIKRIHTPFSGSLCMANKNLWRPLPDRAFIELINGSGMYVALGPRYMLTPRGTPQHLTIWGESHQITLFLCQFKSLIPQWIELQGSSSHLWASQLFNHSSCYT